MEGASVAYDFTTVLVNFRTKESLAKVFSRFLSKSVSRKWNNHLTHESCVFSILVLNFESGISGS
jgi:hypothetical protein